LLLKNKQEHRQGFGGQTDEGLGCHSGCRRSLCTPGIDWAHEWYNNLKQPATNEPCCGGQHCHPVDDDDVRAAGDKLQIFIEGSWQKVDPSLILGR
jgi:hypothetical protein